MEYHRSPMLRYNLINSFQYLSLWVEYNSILHILIILKSNLISLPLMIAESLRLAYSICTQLNLIFSTKDSILYVHWENIGAALPMLYICAVLTRITHNLNFLVRIRWNRFVSPEKTKICNWRSSFLENKTKIIFSVSKYFWYQFVFLVPNVLLQTETTTISIRMLE